MNISVISTKKDVKEFHRLPFIINKNNKYWIPHIKQDVESIFDPDKNFFHQHGEIERFIIRRDGEPIGRIAVFYDKRKFEKEAQPTGGVGFFECINDQKCANLLFNKSIEWLKSKNISAMDGPINFGERDRYWGLLIDGFEKHTVYGQNYNPEYYKKLFENFGFRKYFNQHVYCKDLSIPYPEKFYERSKRIIGRKKIHFDHMKSYDFNKYGKYFTMIYNDAWKSHHGFKEMKTDKAVKMFKKMKSIIDKKLIWFGFYEKTPVCFFIGIPDPNQYFKFINGDLNLLGKIKFMYYKTMNPAKICSGMVFGVIPKFQKLGMESALADIVTKNISKVGYTHVMQTWIGDFNPKMIKVCENFFGSDIHQKLTTYRYLFDKNAPFVPHPII